VTTTDAFSLTHVDGRALGFQTFFVAFLRNAEEKKKSFFVNCRTLIDFSDRKMRRREAKNVIMIVARR
jgi:hypothetical protein